MSDEGRHQLIGKRLSNLFCFHNTPRFNVPSENSKADLSHSLKGNTFCTAHFVRESNRKRNCDDILFDVHVLFGPPYELLKSCNNKELSPNEDLKDCNNDE